MPPITGQSILIIGGSSGIGAGVANLALAEGVSVAIASSNSTRVANTVEKLQKSFPNGQVAGYTCDLNHEDIEARLEKLFTDVAATVGQLDHIVFTAGIINVKPIQELTFDFLQKSGQLSLIAPLLIAKLAPRFLKNSYKSSLIFTSGRVAEKPIPTYTLGSAYASALYGMTRNLALDLAPVRVNLVSPGSTNTELWGSDELRAQRSQYLAKTALLGKVGSAEEVGEAYIYFMKDTNTTGTCLNTNGGAFIQ